VPVVDACALFIRPVLVPISISFASGSACI
jgi:hypothetical protein